MKPRAWIWTLALAVAVGSSAQAQFPPPLQAQVPQRPGDKPPVLIFHLAPPPGPMGGVFSFVGPLADVNSHVVKGEPYSAEVVRHTVQSLADGNRIVRASTGLIARDGQGRTRREMTLENIGPWASAGKAPHLVIINNPVSGKVFTLDGRRKIAIEMTPPPKLNWVKGRRRRLGAFSQFQSDTKTESLGKKKMDGVLVEGTETIRTIPAGAIGNEKPIVITIQRWYSPELQTTIFMTRTDPRFGTTTYQLQNIDLGEPSPSLFEVPADYTVRVGTVHQVGGRVRVTGAGPDFP